MLWLLSRLIILSFAFAFVVAPIYIWSMYDRGASLDPIWIYAVLGLILGGVLFGFGKVARLRGLTNFGIALIGLAIYVTVGLWLAEGGIIPLPGP
jgi:membrane-associated protease RseP (regulator of RpoE activity)